MAEEQKKVIYPMGIYISDTRNENVKKVTIHIDKLVNWLQENKQQSSPDGYITLICGRNSEEKKATMPYPKDHSIYFNPDYKLNERGSNQNNSKARSTASTQTDQEAAIQDQEADKQKEQRGKAWRVGSPAPSGGTDLGWWPGANDNELPF